MGRGGVGRPREAFTRALGFGLPAPRLTVWPPESHLLSLHLIFLIYKMKALDQRVSTGDDLGSQRHLVMAGEIFSYYKEKMMLLVSRGLRPGMLLNILQCTGQIQQRSIIWPQISVAEQPSIRWSDSIVSSPVQSIGNALRAAQAQEAFLSAQALRKGASRSHRACCGPCVCAS